MPDDKRQLMFTRRLMVWDEDYNIGNSLKKGSVERECERLSTPEAGAQPVDREQRERTERGP